MKVIQLSTKLKCDLIFFNKNRECKQMQSFKIIDWFGEKEEIFFLVPFFTYCFRGMRKKRWKVMEKWS